MEKKYVWLVSFIVFLESVFFMPIKVEANFKETFFEIIVYGGTVAGLIGGIYELCWATVKCIRQICPPNNNQNQTGNLDVRENLDEGETNNNMLDQVETNKIVDVVNISIIGRQENDKSVIGGKRSRTLSTPPLPKIRLQKTEQP